MATVFSLLNREPVVWQYTRDKYALDHLQRLAQRGPQKVADLKKGRMAGFLQKDPVKAVLAQIPNGVLEVDNLYLREWQEPLSFVRTLSKWGSEHRKDQRWRQISRPGYNLVIQLNLSRKMEYQYQQRMGADEKLPLWAGHPVSKRYPTLGWARIDFDLEGHSVLIEELQTDLVRGLEYRKKAFRRSKDQARQAAHRNLSAFLKHDFAPYGQLWQESLLAHTLEFIDRELGYRQVFMHTSQWGGTLKRIQHDQPPRSVYESLPRKFGFQKTEENPDCILNDGGFRRGKERRLVDQAEFWKLSW